jgi:membrane protease subunit (stomatin/prohibitin family)
MGLWDKIRGELIDIIEWLDNTHDTLVYRFERYGNEIKYGARLVVREGQVAVFIDRGQLADVFEPGTHTLSTPNVPILSTIQGWKHGFESPFKAEVYFVSTRRFTDQKWGTRNPVMLRDAEFGPVRLRAFGTYTFKVREPDVFLREIVGTEGHFSAAEITTQLRNHVLAAFADVLGESRIPILDLAANYDELSQFLTLKIEPAFAEYGLELSSILVENISLPPVVEKALDERSRMGVLGDLSAYTRLATADAMRGAAENPAGTAAAGMGMGMGFAMGNQMGRAMGGAEAGAAPAAPPPLPRERSFWIAEGGERRGPFSLAEVEARIRSGQVERDCLVWTEGMPQWGAAATVEALAAAFGALPPPLPPPTPGD